MEATEPYLKGLLASNPFPTDDMRAEVIQGLVTHGHYSEYEASVLWEILRGGVIDMLSGETNSRSDPLPMRHEAAVRELVKRTGLPRYDVARAVREYVQAIGPPENGAPWKGAASPPGSVHWTWFLRRVVAFLLMLLPLSIMSVGAALGYQAAGSLNYPRIDDVATDAFTRVLEDPSILRHWLLDPPPSLYGLLGSLCGGAIVVSGVGVGVERRIWVRSFSTALLLVQVVVGGFLGAFVGTLMHDFRWVPAHLTVFVLAALGSGGLLAGGCAIFADVIGFVLTFFAGLVVATVVHLIAFARGKAFDQIMDSNSLFQILIHIFCFWVCPLALIYLSLTHYLEVTTAENRENEESAHPLSSALGHLLMHCLNFMVSMSILYGVYALWQNYYGAQIFYSSSHKGNVTDVCFIDPAAYDVLSGGDDKRVLMHYIDSNKYREANLGEDLDYIFSVASATVGDDWILAAGFAKGKIVVSRHDIKGSHNITLECEDGPVLCLRFSPDARFLLAGSNTEVYLFDIKLKYHINLHDLSFPLMRASVRDVAFSPDGRYALAASGIFDQDWRHVLKLDAQGNPRPVDCVVRVWDLGKDEINILSVRSNRVIARFAMHSAPVHSIAVAPDGKTVFSGSGGGLGFDGEWPKGHSERAIDCDIRHWDLESGRQIARFAGHTGPVNGLDLTGDGRRLVSCGGRGDSTVRLWDIASGKQIGICRAHSGSVNRVRLSGDGLVSASCDDDGTVRLWRWPGDAAYTATVATLDPSPLLERGLQAVWQDMARVRQRGTRGRAN